MRNKFVYFCIVKICASGFDELLESIFCSYWLWKVFPCKSCWEAWRIVSQFIRDQLTMTDEAKLCSLIHSTFEALVLQSEVRCCRRELGPFCWPKPAVVIAVFIAFHRFADICLRCNGFAGIQNALVDQSGSRTPVIMTFFRCKFRSGKGFGDSPKSPV